MKLIKMAGVMLTFRLLLLTSSPSFAQEQAQPPKWEKVADGVQVLRLWKTTLGPKKPEIAVARLSDEKYKEFQKDRKEFAERYIFGFKLNKFTQFRIPSWSSAKKASGSKGDDYVVVALHMTDSSTGGMSAADAVF